MPISARVDAGACRRQSFAAMEASGTAMLDAANVPPERRALPRQADLRYRRQAYELTVPIADGAVTRASLDAAMAAFHAKHELTYGHANRGGAGATGQSAADRDRTVAALTLAQPAMPGGSDAAARRLVRRHRLHADAGALAPRPERGRSRPRAGDRRGGGLHHGRAAGLDRSRRRHGLHSADQELIDGTTQAVRP